MANPDQDSRNSKGQYVRTAEGAERDARAVDLRAEGWTYRRIAEELGYSSHTAVMQACRRAVRDITKGPAEKLLALHVERLETLYEAALEVAEREHVVVSHGKIIRDDDGIPLRDSGPKLAAIREARATLESFRKLAGIDAPSRVSIDAQQLGDEINALLDRATTDADS